MHRVPALKVAVAAVNVNVAVAVPVLAAAAVKVVVPHPLTLGVAKVAKPNVGNTKATASPDANGAVSANV